MLKQISVDKWINHNFNGTSFKLTFMWRSPSYNKAWQNKWKRTLSSKEGNLVIYREQKIAYLLTLSYIEVPLNITQMLLAFFHNRCTIKPLFARFYGVIWTLPSLSEISFFYACRLRACTQSNGIGKHWRDTNLLRGSGLLLIFCPFKYWPWGKHNLRNFLFDTIFLYPSQNNSHLK